MADPARGEVAEGSGRGRSPTPGIALLAGLAGGAWTGLLDAARAAGSAPRPFGPPEFAAVLLLWALAGLAAGFLLLPLRRRVSAGALLLLPLLLAIALLASLEILPRSRATPSSALNALLFVLALGAAAVLLRAVARILDGRFPGALAPRPLGAAAALPLAASAAAALLAAPPGEGPAPGPRPPVVRAAETRPPNLLVVLADTVRADRVGACGGTPGLTPRLDAFAAGGIALSRLRTSSAWTKPSVASFLTGLGPETHRLVEGPRSLPPDTPVLLSFMASAGYRTALVSDSHWPIPEFGFDRGVNSLLVVPGAGSIRGSLPWLAWSMVRNRLTDAFRTGTPAEIRGARALSARFLDWAAREDPRPFAAYLHWMEPHHPYAPCEPSDPARPRVPVPVFRGMVPPDRSPPLPAADLAALTANYDDEVRFVDRAFGELLDGLRERGLLADTVVLFLSDHGEEFHEHGGWTHEHSLHEEVVRVPAVLGGPGLPRGVRDDRDARIEDLLPTLLEAAGLRAAGPFEGASLLPRYLPGAPPGTAAATTGRASRDASPVVLRSALLDGLKVIQGAGGGREFESWFDLGRDPLEKAPLGEPPAPLAESLRRTLREAREREARAPEPPSAEVEGDLRRVLEGLGYFGGGSPR